MKITYSLFPLSLLPSLPPSLERLAELMTGALSRALDMNAIDHHKALAVLYVFHSSSLPPSLLPYIKTSNTYPSLPSSLPPSLVGSGPCAPILPG